MTMVSLDMAYRSFLEVLAGSHPPRYAASLKPSSPRFTHSSGREIVGVAVHVVARRRLARAGGLASDNTATAAVRISAGIIPIFGGCCRSAWLWKSQFHRG